MNNVTSRTGCPECLRLWDACLRLAFSESLARAEARRWRHLCYIIAAVSAATIIVLAWSNS